MAWLARFVTIIFTVYKFGLSDFIRQGKTRSRFFSILSFFPRSFSSRNIPLPERSRLALESLGPVFIKFGQMLSTRRDILPLAYADELAKLQDDVPPFDGVVAKEIIERELKRPIGEMYSEFDLIPVASASVAQVHSAYLKGDNGYHGEKVAVKVLRPNIRPVIEQDLSLMRVVAKLVTRFLPDGKRLRAIEVVDEFDKHLHDELDLMCEAGNASQFARQFPNHPMLIIPKVYYDYSARSVLTLQWMDGIPISDTNKLIEHNIDLKKLAVMGVEIFFTQVFDNGFFHADMHPGNIFVADDGRYIALDFGIVGSLTDFDKRYLATNFLAFFNRDYHRVATAHIESGWVPADTRAEELESAVRTVCEPIFNKPLSEISFGMILLRLFEVSRRFNVEIQPQLVLLQKTLLNIEGLGRELDPNLDLWQTAKPFLIRWTNEQVGFKALWHNVKKEAPDWVRDLPGFPRKINQLIDTQERQKDQWAEAYLYLLRTQKQQSFWLAIIAVILMVNLVWMIWFL